MAHIAVIGGGIAGLTAANALADDGATVTVFEKSREIGGRARTTQRDNYLLNLGPHALYRGGVAVRTFTNWKIPFSGGNPVGRAPNVHPMLVCGGQVYPAVRDLRTLLASRIFSLGEKLEMMRLLGQFNRSTSRPAGSMAEWLDRNTRSRRVWNYAEMLVRVSTYCTNLVDLSARAALAQVSMALKHGVLYLDGGWQILVKGLADRARSLGVEIHCGVPVARLDSIRADGFVLAVDPRTVEILTGIRLPVRKAARTACLDLCLSHLPEGSATVAFSLDRPLYLSVHSAVAQLASAGGAVVHVAKYLDRDENSPHELRRELENYADLVIPGWRQSLVHDRFLPQLAVTDGIPGVAGRADVAVPGVDGVAIAGDWVGSEGMLADAAVASALEAAKRIQRANRLVA